MKEKRFKKKALGALGIAVVIAIGIGLLTAFATSSATADIEVSEEKGIDIKTQDDVGSFDGGIGFGRAYAETDNALFEINVNPDGGNAKDFRLTISEHGSLKDGLYKFAIENADGTPDSNINIYGSDNSSRNNFYINPGSGSTTVYVDLSSYPAGTGYDLQVTLKSVSWTRTPHLGADSTTLVASGKALE